MIRKASKIFPFILLEQKEKLGKCIATVFQFATLMHYYLLNGFPCNDDEKFNKQTAISRTIFPVFLLLIAENCKTKPNFSSF